MKMNRVAMLAPVGLLLAAACGHLGGPSPAPATSGTIAPPATMVDSTSASALRLARYLDGLEALGFSGAVVVEHGGRVVLRGGYGLADREARRPYTPATVQTMGSITKQITGAAILLLDGRGALSIGRSIGEYLPGVPADKQGITLHHLLTHQSGLPEYSGDDAEAVDAATFLARAMQLPLGFAPGDGVAYSNVGYSLLGVIIERMSGRGYEQFVREELLLPAGLAHTGYMLPDRTDAVLAIGYRDGQPYTGSGDTAWLPDGPGWNRRANGGLHTTADDMHRWMTVLRGDGPLSPEQVARWTATHVAAGEEFGIGYGWVIHTSDLGRAVMHGGGNPAFSSLFMWMPEHELFVYAQGNTSRWEIPALQEMLMRAWFDTAFVLPPAVAGDRGADPALAASRAGAYWAGGGVIRLAADDVRLEAGLSGQGTMDAILGHGAAQRERLGQLSRQATAVIERLTEGREDALEGLVRDGTDHAARARVLAQVLSRQGEVRRLSLIGSVDNVTGTRFAQHGGSTTFVRADFEGGRARILSLLWHDDGTYRGATLGPLTDLPSFVLVPTAGGGYTALERDVPWRTQRVTFDGECMVIAEWRGCRMPR